MVKTLFLTAICVLLLPGMPLCEGKRPRVSGLPMSLQGRVYCDTCRAGFETDATTYMPGAKVRVECRNKDSQKIQFSKEGITDSSGTYRIGIEEDHADDLCDVKLISSSESDCATPDPGHAGSRISLSTHNGMSSNDRFANSLGFLRDQALSGCEKIIRKYMEDDG